MRTLRDHAVVLGSHKFGEADRVVILLSEGHGKLRAVARGVRKTRSSIGARLEPMNHVDVSLRCGRELDTVAEVTLVETFGHIRSDFDRMAQGMAMVEAVNKLTPDREPVPHIHELLVRALRSLDARVAPLTLAGFFWRVLQVEGHEPRLRECVRCGTTIAGDASQVRFDIHEGGVHCTSCLGGSAISAEALGILRRMLGGGMNEVLALSESPAVHEVNRLAMDAMEAHLERRLQSLSVFNRHL